MSIGLCLRGRDEVVCGLVDNKTYNLYETVPVKVAVMFLAFLVRICWR